MKTIKVIDLLNKIANGEELPKKIYQHCEEFGNATFELDRGAYWHKKLGGIDDDVDFIAYQTTDTLNDEVEIIEDTPKEDKKINRVERKARNLTNQYIKEKLNEIIDKINGVDNE